MFFQNVMKCDDKRKAVPMDWLNTKCCLKQRYILIDFYPAEYATASDKHTHTHTHTHTHATTTIHTHTTTTIHTHTHKQPPQYTHTPRYTHTHHHHDTPYTVYTNILYNPPPHKKHSVQLYAAASIPLSSTVIFISL